MDNLVKRARDCANGIGDFKSDKGDFGLLDDLADRIEQLEARVAAADKLAEALCAEEETAGQDVWAKLDACKVTDNALAAYEATKEQNNG